MAKSLTPADLIVYNAIVGWGAAKMPVQVLKQCGDDLSRENTMRQAENQKDFELPMLLPGIKVITSPAIFSRFGRCSSFASTAEMGVVRRSDQRLADCAPRPTSPVSGATRVRPTIPARCWSRSSPRSRAGRTRGMSAMRARCWRDRVGERISHAEGRTPLGRPPQAGHHSLFQEATFSFLKICRRDMLVHQSAFASGDGGARSAAARPAVEDRSAQGRRDRRAVLGNDAEIEFPDSPSG